MSDLWQKILLAIATAVVSGTISGAAVYTTKAVQLDGRMAGVERAVLRIETRMDQVLVAQPPKADRQ